MNYYSAIPVEIQITCSIYKLAQGFNLLVCNEFFALESLMFPWLFMNLCRQLGHIQAYY